MRERIIKYADNCLSFFINHTLWAIFIWVFGFISLNVPKLISMLINVGKKFITTSNILSVISILLSIGITIYIGIKIKKPKEECYEEPVTDSEPEETIVTADEVTAHGRLIDDIAFKKVTITMNIKSSDNIQYNMKFDGHVCNENIEKFAKQLNWSGSEYICTEIQQSSIAMRIEDNISDRAQSPYEFKLLFEEDLEIGERIKFETSTYLSDGDKKMIPFSSFCVKYPIETLVLELNVTKDMVKNVCKSIYNDFARESSIFSSKKGFERQEIFDAVKYTWTVTNPKPWLYYSIDWTFTEKY